MKKLKYFTAVWCGPCKTYGPVLKRVDREFDSVNIEKIDIEEQPETAKAFSITNVPTVVEVNENEDELNRLQGAFPYNEVLKHFVIS